MVIMLMVKLIDDNYIKSGSVHQNRNGMEDIWE